MPSGFDVTGPRQDDPAQVRRAQVAIERIEDMLNDDRNRWKFAEDTLRSLLEGLEKYGRLNERGFQAIDNIEASVRNR